MKTRSIPILQGKHQLLLNICRYFAFIILFIDFIFGFTDVAKSADFFPLRFAAEAGLASLQNVVNFDGSFAITSEIENYVRPLCVI